MSSLDSSRPRRAAPRRSLSILRLVASFILLVTLRFAPLVVVRAEDEVLPNVYALETDGVQSLEKGKDLFDEGTYMLASRYFWRAVLLQSASDNAYTVEEAYSSFMQCYSILDKTVDGFVFVAQESFQRGQKDMAKKYIEQALSIDRNHAGALEFLETMGFADGDSKPTKNNGKKPKRREKSNNFQPEFGTPEADDPLTGKSPEELYDYGSTLFNRRNYEHCADVFELSCRRSNLQLGPACSNAVYCRSMILDWGFNGTTYEEDMQRITELTQKEVDMFRQGNLTHFKWNRATSTHPHMMLGYQVPPMLKRYVAESVAYMDEAMARVSKHGKLEPLPEDLPYKPQEELQRYIEDSKKPGFKLRVGFVGSGFNSKAVLYLSQDIFRFYNRDKIEMHIFSCGPADNEPFIRIGMRGVDWRERVKAHVAPNFHDVESFKMDHIAMARYIRKRDIHILIEWDGYARQGERAQGLMALRPAPIQILHQEFLGTSGAQYVDYLVTDEVSSPKHLRDLYTEKLIYMPNHFFSKGHAVQSEVTPPSYDYKPATKPYTIGTGSPEENMCLSGSFSPGSTTPTSDRKKKPSFVFCNFNKFLKNNPETMRSWMRILREVPGSILCLLENPTSGIPYGRRFMHEAAGKPVTFEDERSGKLYDTFKAKDGDKLNDRIRFLPWERNPFDHQRRNHDYCNVMLDSTPYNGHTVAQDSLYGGVPIVTRSDGDDMCSRVSTSANIVLGLDEELNANGGPSHYEELAIALGNNRTKFESVRRRLIDTALQRNPMHPYWDAARYAKNLETGLQMAWDRFVSGLPPDHIIVVESEEAKRGTYDDFLEKFPSDPPKVTFR